MRVRTLHTGNSIDGIFHDCTIAPSRSDGVRRVLSHCIDAILITYARVGIFFFFVCVVGFVNVNIDDTRARVAGVDR